ncbi:hypothetical protein BLNAU_13845 [Blattamonas nauphoetae]|uniref:C3H1-type domain-containing protein n=1 Tax=Blattamonas nauphoetae TaxID=2049346 RepID=A0ABQ9XHP1_9EUKA|nr:hypothetical protein BLNAU_13845 [Blattamonas nauphoetae]
MHPANNKDRSLQSKDARPHSKSRSSRPTPLKTNECYHWITKGHCKYGKDCCFAHSQSELQPNLQKEGITPTLSKHPISTPSNSTSPIGSKQGTMSQSEKQTVVLEPFSHSLSMEEDPIEITLFYSFSTMEERLQKTLLEYFRFWRSLKVGSLDVFCMPLTRLYVLMKKQSDHKIDVSSSVFGKFHVFCAEMEQKGLLAVETLRGLRCVCRVNEKRMEEMWTEGWKEEQRRLNSAKEKYRLGKARTTSEEEDLAKWEMSTKTPADHSNQALSMKTKEIGSKCGLHAEADLAPNQVEIVFHCRRTNNELALTHFAEENDCGWGGLVVRIWQEEPHPSSGSDDGDQTLHMSTTGSYPTELFVFSTPPFHTRSPDRLSPISLTLTLPSNPPIAPSSIFSCMACFEDGVTPVNGIRSFFVVGRGQRADVIVECGMRVKHAHSLFPTLWKEKEEMARSEEGMNQVTLGRATSSFFPKHPFTITEERPQLDEKPTKYSYKPQHEAEKADIEQDSKVSELRVLSQTDLPAIASVMGVPDKDPNSTTHSFKTVTLQTLGVNFGSVFAVLISPIMSRVFLLGTHPSLVPNTDERECVGVRLHSARVSVAESEPEEGHDVAVFDLLTGKLVSLPSGVFIVAFAALSQSTLSICVPSTQPALQSPFLGLGKGAGKKLPLLNLASNHPFATTVVLREVSGIVVNNEKGTRPAHLPSSFLTPLTTSNSLHPSFTPPLLSKASSSLNSFVPSLSPSLQPVRCLCDFDVHPFITAKLGAYFGHFGISLASPEHPSIPLSPMKVPSFHLRLLDQKEARIQLQRTERRLDELRRTKEAILNQMRTWGMVNEEKPEPTQQKMSRKGKGVTLVKPKHSPILKEKPEQGTIQGVSRLSWKDKVLSKENRNKDVDKQKGSKERESSGKEKESKDKQFIPSNLNSSAAPFVPTRPPHLPHPSQKRAEPKQETDMFSTHSLHSINDAHEPRFLPIYNNALSSPPPNSHFLSPIHTVPSLASLAAHTPHLFTPSFTTLSPPTRFIQTPILVDSHISLPQFGQEGNFLYSDFPSSYSAVFSSFLTNPNTAFPTHFSIFTPKHTESTQTEEMPLWFPSPPLPSLVALTLEKLERGEGESRGADEEGAGIGKDEGWRELV